MSVLPPTLYISADYPSPSADACMRSGTNSGCSATHTLFRCLVCGWPLHAGEGTCGFKAGLRKGNPAVKIIKCGDT